MRGPDRVAERRKMKKPLLWGLLLFFFLAGESRALPSYQEVRRGTIPSDSLLLDRNGEVLQEMRVDKARRRLDWTPLPEISPALIEAVIAAEDRRFFGHPGIDVRSAAGALFKGLTREAMRGASTLTMQLASLLDRSLQPGKTKRSLWQKVRQAMEALDLERAWTKQEILEAYLNLVTFRGELQGVAAASRGLFGKAPHGLDRAEALVLSSLLRAPGAPAVDLARRAEVLGRALGWTEAVPGARNRAVAVAEGAPVLRPRADLAPHAGRDLLKGREAGVAISSTLDARLQAFALDRLNHHLKGLRLQNVRDGAVLVVENRTGEVLAYGSCSGEESKSRFVDGIRAKRQAGSTLKPFLYGLAFDRRLLTPASLLKDEPIDIATPGGLYQPRDYDGDYKGAVTLRTALASSLNVPAVRTLLIVGTEPFLSLLRQFGLSGLHESGDFYGPSLALGSADVSLWELVNAYRALANGGTWTGLSMVKDEPSSSPPRKGISREAAFLVSDILSDREARAATFGFENPLATRFWTAVKTGTSKDMRDNWCVGYTRRYTVGVWVGNFTGEPMWNVSGVTGAAPLWAETMGFLHGREEARPEPPPGVVRKRVDFPPSVASAREEWFLRGTEPIAEVKEASPPFPVIAYPPAGTVLSLDPDIPEDHQRVYFLARGKGVGQRWEIDGEPLGAMERAVHWIPRVGRHRLALIGGDGRTVDAVRFEVRGPVENTVISE
jgi:penicillin-binding protein 1C